jgi:hypothetical protein
MNYLTLLEQLGPTPKFSEVGQFLGLDCWEVTQLVKRGELEAIQTSKKRRICLNSLAEYLHTQELANGKWRRYWRRYADILQTEAEGRTK